MFIRLDIAIEAKSFYPSHLITDQSLKYDVLSDIQEQSDPRFCCDVEI